jgi:hypothetical protein
MTRSLSTALFGVIALAIWGQAAAALAEEPIVLLLDDPVLVPADWQAQAADAFADADLKLDDGALMDPFHGRDKLADPWSRASAKSRAPALLPDCNCTCDVLVPADWR